MGEAPGAYAIEEVVTLEPHDHLTGMRHSGHCRLVSRRPARLLSVGTTPEAKRSNQYQHRNKPFHAEFHRARLWGANIKPRATRYQTLDCDH